MLSNADLVRALGVAFCISSCGGDTDAETGQSPGGTGGGVATGGATAAGGSGAGTGFGGSGGSGSSTPMQCGVPFDPPGPYPTTLRLTNPTNEPLWVTRSCGLIQWELLTCENSYQTVITTDPGCTLVCGDATSDCMLCEPCKLEEELVTPGGSLDVPWSGETYTFEHLSDCDCYDKSFAIADGYAVQIPVHTNNAESGWLATTYFQLPTQTGIVTVPLVADQ